MNLLEKLKTNFEEFVESKNLGDVLSGKELANPNSVKEPIEISLDYPFELGVESGNLRLNNEAKFQISLFNNLDEDEDKDDNLLQNENPFIAFNPDFPVLKYQLGFKISPGFKGSISVLSFGIDTSASIELATYLKHNKDESVREAVASDFGNIPVVFKLDDVKELKENECVTYNCTGKIAMQLGFNIAELLLACVPWLKVFYNISKSTIVDAEILDDNVDLMFSIEDSFKFAITKVEKEQYKVSIKKSKYRNAKIGAGAGIKLAIKNTDKISKYVKDFADSFLAAIAETSVDKLNEEIDKINEDIEKAIEVLEEKDSLLNKLLAYFNIDGVNQAAKLEKLVEKVNGIRAKIKDVNNLIENAELSASVKFEYDRVSSDDEILGAKISWKQLDKNFKNLIKLDTISLLEDEEFRKNINEYLRTKKVDETHKWSFGLGIGSLKFSAENEFDKEIDKQCQIKLSDDKKSFHTKILYDGLRKFERKGFSKNEVEWLVGFSAGMPNFSTNTYPKTVFQTNDFPDVNFDEFDYGFSFSQRHFENKFRENRREKRKFLEFMNIALIWDIIPNDEFIAQCERIWEFINTDSGSSEVEISLHLQLSRISSNMANRIYGVLNNDEACLISFSKAFARLTPYMDGYGYRMDVDKRVDLYYKYWLKYFKTERRAIADVDNFGKGLGLMIVDKLEEVKDTKLSVIESDFNESGSFYKTFVPLASNWNPKKRVDSFRMGFKELLFNFLKKSDKGSHKVIANSFKQMRDMWRTDDLATALGGFFIEVTKDSPTLSKEIKRGIEIEYTDKKGKKRKLDIS